MKASVIMGIQELERNSQVQHLSAQSIEDIVGKSLADPLILFDSNLFPALFYIFSKTRRIYPFGI